MDDEVLFYLPFDPILQTIEETIKQLPMQVQYEFCYRDYIGHLLEELCVKIWDQEATSAVARATAYLKLCHVEEEFAARFSHHVLDAIWELIVTYFPNISFQELAAARYIADERMQTLLVYFPITHEKSTHL